MQVIPILIALLDENDPATQRLGASALCNLAANHDENKQKCREAVSGLLSQIDQFHLGCLVDVTTDTGPSTGRD
jgi:hypothetical protein